MTDFMEVVLGRRAIRNFEKKDIPEEILNKVLEAVRWAPSWANTQCWEIVVVKDKAVKEKLQATFPKVNPGGPAIEAAPITIVVCGRLGTSGYFKDKAMTIHGDWFMFDLGLAVENLCLTAYSLGLGTVITGAFDHNQVKEILKVPEGYEVVTVIPLGYPAKGSPAPARREIADFTHYDSF